MEMALCRRGMRAYGRRNFVELETGTPSACVQEGFNGGGIYTPGASYSSVVWMYKSGDGYSVFTPRTAAVGFSSGLPEVYPAAIVLRTWNKRCTAVRTAALLGGLRLG